MINIIPKCSVCGANAQHTGTRHKDGSIRYRWRKDKGWVCGTHHLKFTKQEHPSNYDKSDKKELALTDWMNRTIGTPEHFVPGTPEEVRKLFVCEDK